MLHGACQAPWWDGPPRNLNSASGTPCIPTSPDRPLVFTQLPTLKPPSTSHLHPKTWLSNFCWNQINKCVCLVIKKR
jgi:hypothetical protein